MKQKLLLLMALLLSVTIMKAQTFTLGETSIVRTYDPGTTGTGTTGSVAINNPGNLTLDPAIVVSDPNVVDAIFDSGNLKLTFKNKGTSTVTVKTTTSQSATVTVTINPKTLVLKLTGTAFTLDYDYSFISKNQTRGIGDFGLEGVYPLTDVSLKFAIGNTALFCQFLGTSAGPCPVQVSGYDLDGADKGNYTVSPSTSIMGEITKSNQETNLLAPTAQAKPLADGFIKFNITAKGIVSPTTPTFEVVSNTAGLVENPTFTSLGSNLWQVSFKLLKASSSETAVYKIKVPSSANYNEGSLNVTLSVTPPTTPNTFIPAVGTWTEPNPKIVYGGSYTMPFRTADNAAITYSYTGNPNEVTISGTQITFKKAGPVVINIKAAQTVGFAETLAQVTFNIQQKELVMGNLPVPVKTWDGTPTITPAIDWTACTLAGILFSDDVSLNYSGVTAVYSAIGASTGTIPVTVTGLGLTGTKSSNYILKQPTIQGRINKANQPDAFLNMNNTTINGVKGGTWSYGFISSAIGGVVTKSNSNPTALLDDGTSIITFNGSGNNMSITFTAPGDNDHNPGTAIVKFNIAATDVIAVDIPSSNLATVSRQVYKSAPQLLSITASYNNGTTTIPVPAANLKFESTNPAVATVTGSGPFDVNYLKAGSASITVSLIAPIGGVTMPSYSFLVAVEKRDLPINGISVTPRDYAPGDKSVPVPDANWAAQTITPIAGDLVQYTASSTSHPVFLYETDQSGSGKKIVISNANNCLTGNDAINYNLIVSTPGTITKASQGDMNLGTANPVLMTAKYGNDLILSPVVFENAIVNYSSGNTAIAEFPAINIGTATLKAINTVTLTVTAKETTNYRLTTKNISLTIGKGDQVFNIVSLFNRQLQSGPFQLEPNAKDNPTYTYTIDSGSDVISVAADGTVTPKKAGTARVTITALATTNYNIGSKVVDIVITDGITITTQPVGATICAGADYTFSAIATGSGILTYQWLFNGSPISGATQNIYPITNVKATQAGKYSVRVTNGTETVTSTQVDLIVSNAVSIMTHLVATQTACVGAKDTLKVRASGNNLTYQWYLNGQSLTSARDSAYVISNVAKTHAGKYKVEVTGSCIASGTLTTTADSCTLNVLTPLPTRLKTDIPDSVLYTNKGYTFKVGEAGTAGYEGVTKYTWTYNGTGAAFNSATTTTNENVFMTKLVPGDGTIRIDLEHFCGNEYVERDVHISYPTGIDNIGNAGMKIYPNPVTANESLNIDLGNGNNNAQIYIYNVTGSLVYNTGLAAQVTHLSANLKPGIYMMKIVTANGKTAHHKFIVK